MALKKEIINEKGIKLEYHRISNFTVDKDNNIIIVTIKSYTSNIFRDDEKENIKQFELVKSKNKMYGELNTLLAENVDGNLDVEVKKLSDELDAFKLPEYLEEKNNVVSVTIINLEYDENIEYSLAKLYELLKQEDVFKNAEDC